ncbi:serpin family protein [Calothrix sp. NIES-3974]|uniref:serpin family protein n=1 Tax=Calothrix sp. NIES-3974 TaxID=2005462 RepID=UPI000BBC06A6|nr:serpin family protein [Calothrix sp. NIES-3974]
MKYQSNTAREIFLQRRYGVQLGRRYVLAAASVMLIGVLGCSQISSNSERAIAESPSPRTEVPRINQPMTPDPKIIAANTKFGFKLFTEVQKQDQNQNIFVSPASVAMALAMTYNGASGSTQEKMAQTLELQGFSLEQINSTNAELAQLLTNPDEKVKLTIANSLWANQNIQFQPDFLQRNRDFYNAKVTNLNFAANDATNQINNWVKDNTQGKIEKIVEQIHPNQALFLINAIYFKGNWSREFDKNQTTDLPFYLPSGQQKQHPMMSQRGKYRYYETPEFQAVSLPYGKDGKISMYVFLPKENSSLAALQQNLNSENWQKWMGEFNQRQGLVRLPKFKMDYDVNLNDALTALGMGEAFTDKANFSGMGKNLSISEVKHKTFVEVNEEGTEAAAVTSVGIVRLSAVQEEPPFEMVVDRPFFTAIRDNQTGSILFMGSIVNPT